MPPVTRKETGQQGELLAQNYLKKRGYRIIETNYRSRYGEIDIIAKHNKHLVFIEVRTKKSREFGSPEESITEAKAGRLRATACQYKETHSDLPDQCGLILSPLKWTIRVSLPALI
jgi:putative endonuclease